ncbi:endonuclease domain-containing protein [Vibrio fortis]|uniref:endonuclease domain-containing protein n=1 Tax=Vibrio fortis TaxID=212667 RepID=UPI0038CD1722
MTKQLKTKELDALRVELLSNQNSSCPICKRKHKKTDRTWHIDHAHANEQHAHKIRACLCPRCNTCLGSVWKTLIRTGLVNEHGLEGCIAWLSAASKYYQQDYSLNDYHPNRIQDEAKRFSKLNKPEQLALLTNSPAKATKAELVRLYKKQLRNQ